MPYDIRFSEIGNTLRVEVSGDRNAEDSVRLWKAVGERCTAGDHQNVLAVLHLRGGLPPGRAYEIAAAYAEYGLTPAHRIAAVSDDPESVDFLEFARLVAGNRGLKIKIFASENLARAWLDGG